MKLFKKIAVRLLPVAFLAFVSVAAIAYQRGVYDITFIERPSSSESNTSDTSSPPVTTSPPESNGDTSDIDPIDSTSLPDDDTSSSEGSEELPKTDAITDFLNSLKSTSSMLSSGWEVSDAVYSSGMRLTLLDPSVSLDGNFTLRKKTSTEYTRVPNEKYGGYTTESSTIYVDRPLVEVYMDYILVDNGSTVSLLNGSGDLLDGSFDINLYLPAYTRDSDGAPQFKTVTTSRYGVSTVKYFMFDENGGFVASDYNDAAENRGLYINYPSYYGVSDSSYTRAYKDGSYGYATQRAGVLSGYRYTGAYEFSEELAATTKLDEVLGVDVLSYVNTRFTNKITGSASAYNHGPYYNLSGRRVSSVYRLPDTRGTESLGFFYFDHGLVRIRRQEYDYYHTYDSLAYDYHGHYILCCTDEDLVMRSDGTLYDVPGGYTVKAYSDGIFLLEKDGLYGFMDYTGSWIAQPIYDYAEPFSEGLAVIGSGDKRGVIDTNGRFVIPMLFDYIQSCSGGIIPAWDGANGWHIFNKVK